MIDSSQPSKIPSKVSADALNTFFKRVFAEKFKGQGGDIAPPEIIEVEYGRIRLRLTANAAHIRPGGFISGPTQMTLADHAAYAAVFTQIGIVPMAVTSNLSINFLRPSIGEWLEAEAKVLKLGKTLAVIDVAMRASGKDKLCSQASVTYAIPVQP